MKGLSLPAGRKGEREKEREKHREKEIETASAYMPKERLSVGGRNDRMKVNEEKGTEKECP